MCREPAEEHEYPVVSLGGTYTQHLRAPFVARRFADWDLLVDMANDIPMFPRPWWRGPRVCLSTHVRADQ
jgi:hypothetical protein